MEYFFAPCPRGLESVLVRELTSIGATEVEATDGGVHFSGPFPLCYAVNLESRIASRVLWRVAVAGYRFEDDIYRTTFALRWPHWFSVDSTIRVNVSAIGCQLKSLDFVTLRIKDAVCDRFRQDTGKRPDVDTANPAVRIHAFLTAQQITFYLDTSGEPLFKRGYRKTSGEAPLRENLAAGILRLADWRPSEPLLDPMCGSGTLLIEAGLIALDIAPGINRSFAFEKLAGFDHRLWENLRNAVRAGQKPPGPRPLHGSDLYGDELKKARANLKAAGLEGVVTLKQANILEVSPPAPRGVLIANPPYGARLGKAADLAHLYPKLGDVLKQRFSGWRAYLFSGDRELPRLIRLTPGKRTPLFNGGLECRLYEFLLVPGSMRRPKQGRNESREQPRKAGEQVVVTWKKH
jgi:putative N6-adenine-specific DNA methylase